MNPMPMKRPMNQREKKVEVIRQDLLDFIDKMTESIGGDKGWVSDFPEKMLEHIEQVERDFEYAL